MKSSAKTEGRPSGQHRPPSLTSQEATLLRHYVRLGATEDRVGMAARRSKITEKYALTLLKRPHVQAELAKLKLILYREQARLDAADISRREVEEDVMCRETERRAMRRLNELLDLEPGNLKAAHTIHMEVLKLALVVAGTIRTGRAGTERLAPPDGGGLGGAASTTVPGSFFERGMVSAADAAPLFGGEQVSDQGGSQGHKPLVSEKPPTTNLTPDVQAVSKQAAEQVSLEALEVGVKKKPVNSGQ